VWASSVARGVPGVDADVAGQGCGRVEGRHPDGVGEQLCLDVQDLLAGVQLAQRHPGGNHLVCVLPAGLAGLFGLVGFVAGPPGW